MGLGIALIPRDNGVQVFNGPAVLLGLDRRVGALQIRVNLFCRRPIAASAGGNRQLRSPDADHQGKEHGKRNYEIAHDSLLFSFLSVYHQTAV